MLPYGILWQQEQHTAQNMKHSQIMPDSWLFPRPVTCGLNQDITDTMNKSIKIQLITKVLFIRFQFYYIAKGTTFILKAFIPLCHYEIGAGRVSIERSVPVMAAHKNRHTLRLLSRRMRLSPSCHIQPDSSGPCLYLSIGFESSIL